MPTAGTDRGGHNHHPQRHLLTNRPDAHGRHRPPRSQPPPPTSPTDQVSPLAVHLAGKYGTVGDDPVKEHVTVEMIDLVEQRPSFKSVDIQDRLVSVGSQA